MPRILIAGEDGVKGTVPRGRPAFERVYGAIKNSLTNQGYDVLIEEAATMDTHVQGRQFRKDTELIQIARDIGADVIVIFSVFPRLQKINGLFQIKARVTGRLISVVDNRAFGNFEISPAAYKAITPPFTKTTAHEALGDIAQPFGQEVGDALATKLNSLWAGADSNSAAMGPAVEWTLTFDGFSMDEMLEIEDFLVIFSGYDSLRPCSTCMNTSSLHNYWYKSSLNTAKMKRNMYKVMKELQHKTRIQMASRKIEVKKVTTPKHRRKPSSSDW
ncbi:hypothetical protein [Maridesulfovibrio sp.]|uniref:hypothetical protein n=1 Tax=Maridesulfovibrio sp. TaxID=2795000 RepID=UPI0029CA8216|nr:hypothetical protein [Maridesulfovibrio sp.]